MVMSRRGHNDTAGNQRPRTLTLKRAFFVSLEGSDHLVTVRGQAHRAARVIGAWADAYLRDPNLNRPG